MDRQFLEFLGNLLINTAKGQKQVEEMARWMGQPTAGGADMANLFQKIYGLEKQKEESQEFSKAFEEATEKFRSSLNAWMDVMDYVPQNKYQALKKKYDTLKEKTVDQEEAIRVLETALQEKGMPQTDAIKGFTDLMKTQAGQFQELMESVGRSFKTDKKR